MILEKNLGKESGVYLIFTFLITWIMWLLAYKGFISSWEISTDLLIRLGTAVPSITGLVLTCIYGGKKELRISLRSLVCFKASPAWWIYSFFLFPLILLTASVIFLLTGGNLPPAQFPISFIPIGFLYILLFMGPLGEELGWRGFLLERLLQQWGFMLGGGILGIIWSIWHMPLFFIPGTIQSELIKIGLLPAILGYCLYTVCISFLITILYVRTKGNLLLCLFFHTMCNLSLGVIPLILSKTGAAILLTILIISTALIIKIKGIKEYVNYSGKGKKI